MISHSCFACGRAGARSRQSGMTTSIRTRNRDHESTCSSLESLANSERLWSELQTRERIIRQLRSKIDQLEPSRAEAERLAMINVSEHI